MPVGACHTRFDVRCLAMQCFALCCAGVALMITCRGMVQGQCCMCAWLEDKGWVGVGWGRGWDMALESPIGVRALRVMSNRAVQLCRQWGQWRLRVGCRCRNQGCISTDPLRSPCAVRAPAHGNHRGPCTRARKAREGLFPSFPPYLHRLSPCPCAHHGQLGDASIALIRWSCV